MTDGQMESVTRQVREIMKNCGEFKPCVIYHEELDWIEVITEDCSFSQIHKSGMFPKEFCLHERNYHEEGHLHVGFTFGGAKIFCKENGLPFCGTVSVSTLLRKKAEVDPKARLAILDIALPLLADHHLDEVTFPG